METEKNVQKKLRAPRRADEEGKVGNLILRLCAGGAAVAASLVGYRLMIACLCVLRANTNPVHSSSGQILQLICHVISCAVRVAIAFMCLGHDKACAVSAGKVTF